MCTQVFVARFIRVGWPLGHLYIELCKAFTWFRFNDLSRDVILQITQCIKGRKWSWSLPCFWIHGYVLSKSSFFSFFFSSTKLKIITQIIAFPLELHRQLPLIHSRKKLFETWCWVWTQTKKMHYLRNWPN